MKLLKLVRNLIVVQLIFLAGFFTHEFRHLRFLPDAVGRVDSIVYSDSLAPYEKLWRAETARRFPDAVMIMGHGADLNGEWYLAPDALGGLLPLPPVPMKDVVLQVRKQYPTRTIVIMSCNPGHYHLNFPNVAYATEDVYVIPDKGAAGRWGAVETGSIFEFDFNE